MTSAWQVRPPVGTPLMPQITPPSPVIYKSRDTQTVGASFLSKLQSTPTEFGRQFQSPSFKVIVGPSGKTYYVNESVLSNTSPYFKKLLSFPGKEEASKSVTLSTEVDTEIAFEKFLHYAYSGYYVFTGVEHENATPNPEDPKRLEEQAMLHAQVYVLAERLMMEGLKSFALDEMIAVLADAYVHPASNQARGQYETPPEVVSDNQTSISATCIVELISLIYRGTKDSVEVAAEAMDGRSYLEVRRDPMRVLISRFAASYLSLLKKESIFLEILRGDGDFSVDLVLESPDDKRVQLDEKNRLSDVIKLVSR